MMSCLLEIQTIRLKHIRKGSGPLSDHFKPNLFFHFCQEVQTIFSAHRRGCSGSGNIEGTRGSPSLP